MDRSAENPTRTMAVSSILRLSTLLACLLVTVGCQRVELPHVEADAQGAQTIRAALMSGAASGAGDSAASQQSLGSGWATLKGQFTFDAAATPRARQPLVVTKDNDVCAPGGQQVLDQMLLVDSSTRGIADIAIYLRKAPRVHDSAKPDAQPVVFDQKDCIFLSHVLPVSVGQTLEIRNSDPVGHNTKIELRGGTFNQMIQTGEPKNYQLTREEAFPQAVTCNVHPWMRAYLLPRGNPYFAVTAADGSFEIANLPAGVSLEFQVWHENASGTGGALVVDTPETGELKWSPRGRFTVEFQEDEVRTLNLEVPAGAFKG